MLFAAKVVDNSKLSEGFIRHALDEYKHCFIFTNIKNQIISEYKINKKELSFIPNHIYNKGYIYKDHFIFEKKKLNDFAIFVGANEEIAEKKLLAFTNHLKEHKVDFICLAGYMKIISNTLIKNYQRKIINIHPSLLPKFKGLNTFSRMLKNNEVEAGCTVHYVNKKLDSGNKILQKKFFINTNDDEKILKTKTQKLEYRAFPEAIIKIFRHT